MNINQKFSILFWLRKARMNKKGFAPIWVRITIEGARADFASSKQVETQYWDNIHNEVSAESEEAEMINGYLTMVKADILRHYNILLSTRDRVTPDDVKNSFKGIKEVKKTFLQLFREYNSMLKRRTEIDDLSMGRYKRFLILFDKVTEFIQHKFDRQDVAIEDLKLGFVVEFQQYLRLVQSIGNNTSMKYAKDLKMVMKHGITLGYLQYNPFEQFRVVNKAVTRIYLDKEELTALSSKVFESKRLEEVRDCYLFCCYTGFAYSDAQDLTLDNVRTGIDGTKWIIRVRKKTGNTENVPLLPLPLKIIEKYKKHDYCKAYNKLLPMDSNQRYNSYLKEIAVLCGIDKELTTHSARHTFATTVLLTNDVPIETVKELLGHSDIRTTQIYAKIVQKKVSNDMIKLKEKLSVFEKENVG